MRGPETRVLPLRTGVGASTITLPPGHWPTVLAFLTERFPHVAADEWAARMARGLVCDERGEPLDAAAGYRAGARVRYYRELAEEPVVAGAETILYQDEDLLIADKPHGLAVVPAGRYARETLLARLRRRVDLPELAPLHRLDRDTAGVVAFSTRLATRSAFQALWRMHEVERTYEALAPPLPDLAFPLIRRSRIERGEPFFRMREVAGEPNSETHLDVAARAAAHWRYRLQPRTGRKHQLRVHLAALGAGIMNDPLYPELRPAAETGMKPLQLLARTLAFDDPLSGARRSFTSARELEG